MIEIWNSLTEGQGSVLLGVLTIAAAIVGVSLGSRLFGGKVSDLRGALEQSQEAIKQHEASVNQKLASLLETVTEVEKNVVSALQKINQAGGSLNAIEATEDDVTASAAGPSARLEAIRHDWEAIREKLEDLVSSPDIDGRTRARYARMDRRNYAELLEAYNYDYRLPNVNKYRRALEIRQKYRSGRATPAKAEVDEMSQLRKDLVGS